jgi:hypothetical protein
MLKAERKIARREKKLKARSSKEEIALRGIAHRK